MSEQVLTITELLEALLNQENHTPYKYINSANSESISSALGYSSIITCLLYTSECFIVIGRFFFIVVLALQQVAVANHVEDEVNACRPFAIGLVEDVYKRQAG